MVLACFPSPNPNQNHASVGVHTCMQVFVLLTATLECTPAWMEQKLIVHGWLFIHDIMCLDNTSMLSHSTHIHTHSSQSQRLVAIKQIALKAVPGKLSNIRQKEITILKVSSPSTIKKYLASIPVTLW